MVSAVLENRDLSRILFRRDFRHLEGSALFVDVAAAQFRNFILDLSLVARKARALVLRLVRRSGGMADAQASGACYGNIVWVQVPSPAFPIK